MALLDAIRRMGVNPEDDQAQQPMTMAPAAPEGMAASTVQHPMHAMVAPIVGKPEPPPDSIGMSAGDEAQIEGQQMSAAPTSKQPKVRTMAPMERQEDNINQKLMADYHKDQDPWGSADNHPGFLGKLGHFGSQMLANAHHVSGELTPREDEEKRLGAEQQGLEKQQSEQALQSAQTEGAQQKGDLEEQQARAAELTPTSQEESDAFGVPVGTMLNAASRAALGKQAGINGTKIQTTGMTVQGRQDVADANNLTKAHLATLKPEQRDDRAIRLMEKPAEQRTQEENAYLGSYARWVQQTKVDPGIARAQAYGMFRPVQVLGPDGEVHYDYSGHAIKSGSSTPQSMNFRTGVGMARFMTSGKGGQTINAYNVSNDHLDLFGKAMDALQNGDVQGLNRLNNAFKEQFGSPAPTNVNAIKAMLAGELANIAKVTGATDPEIQEQKANINRASSPEQIMGFIDTNHDLMDQKAYEMYNQYQQGMQGKPAFGGGRSGHNPAGAGGGQPADPNPNNVKPGYRRMYVEGRGWGSVPNG